MLHSTEAKHTHTHTHTLSSEKDGCVTMNRRGKMKNVSYCSGRVKPGMITRWTCSTWKKSLQYLVGLNKSQTVRQRKGAELAVGRKTLSIHEICMLVKVHWVQGWLKSTTSPAVESTKPVLLQVTSLFLNIHTRRHTKPHGVTFLYPRHRTNSDYFPTQY
jgi:hypothetical protein